MLCDSTNNKDVLVSFEDPPKGSIISGEHRLLSTGYTISTARATFSITVMLKNIEYLLRFLAVILNDIMFDFKLCQWFTTSRVYLFPTHQRFQWLLTGSCTSTFAMIVGTSSSKKSNLENAVARVSVTFVYMVCWSQETFLSIKSKNDQKTSRHL